MASLIQELRTQFVGQRVRIIDSDDAPSDIVYGVCSKITTDMAGSYNMHLEGQRRFGFRAERRTDAHLEGEVFGGVTRRIELICAESAVVNVWCLPPDRGDDDHRRQLLTERLECAVRDLYPEAKVFVTTPR